MEFFLGFVVGVVVGVFGTLAVKSGWGTGGTAGAGGGPRGRSNSSAAAVAAEEKTLLDEILGDGPANDKVAELRQNLRNKFMHDDVKVERAIQQERERAPNASDEELLKAAIYRWERDNR